MRVHQESSEVTPQFQAAILLAAREVSNSLSLQMPSSQDIIRATEAGRSQAYELKSKLMKLGPELQRPLGRPALQPAPLPSEEKQVCEQISLPLSRFIKANPGCIVSHSVRAKYHPKAINSLLNLRSDHADLPLTAFCQATDVPLDTMRDWLAKAKSAPTLKRVAERSGAGPEATNEPMAELDAEKVRLESARFQTVANAYENWTGNFGDFVSHVKTNLRIPLSAALIAKILELAGLRDIKRRPGRSPDEKALRQQFQTWFPGAQWVADGSPILSGR